MSNGQALRGRLVVSNFPNHGLQLRPINPRLDEVRIHLATMSLRGRVVLDRLHRTIGGIIKFPVPPYGQPEYWESCYRSLGPESVVEWGSVGYADVATYEYQLLDAKGTIQGSKRSSTLEETLCVQPESEGDQPVLLLGCGNSRLGEDLLENQWKGPILQVDISERAIQALSIRCEKWMQNGDMNLIQDDATTLSNIPDGSVHGVLDKGLIDALYCAREFDQCMEILQAVHRVLLPGGVFGFFSFSRPQYLLDSLPPIPTKNWSEQDCRLLPSILLYRFVKTPRPQKIQWKKK